MDALLKDRYSILEAVDLIARDHENLTKDFIRNFLLSDRPMEISDAIERAVYIRKQTGYQDYNGRQALDRISLSRDELERCSEYLGRTYPKESPAPKSAKRGRPKSHDQRKRDIEKATAEYSGKKIPRSEVIRRVARKLEMSTGTLERYYLDIFNEWKKPTKNR